jgi:hypothetical protein
MPATQDRELRIVACQQIYTGLNAGGHRYTIFDVEAARPDTGELIKEKLRSFEALPVGEVLLLTVTPFESERHGRSFTLHRKVSTNTTGQVNDVKAQLLVLEQRIAALVEHGSRLEERVARLEGYVGAAQPANSSQQSW